MKIKTLCSSFALILAAILSGCFNVQKSNAQTLTQQTDQSKQDIVPLPKNLKRPVPNPIKYSIPNRYKRAIKKGTRTKEGKPGPNYWQQYSQYKMNVKIIPDKKKLKGSGSIVYHNNSPDTLRQLYLELALNYRRNGTKDIEKIDSFSVDGHQLTQRKPGGSRGFFRSHNTKPGYRISGTNMIVHLPQPILPGKTAKIKIKWHFKIPVSAAGGRMGYYNEDNFFYLAYWYPQIRVYDDVIGWFTTPFEPRTEFYHEFADYNVKITVPDQWIVNATGALKNAKDLLQDDVYGRLQKAYKDTTIVQVVSPKDFGHVTKTSNDGYLTWKYKAHQVNDFAFSATKNTVWDATTTSVGDRSGDGKIDYTKINAIYNPADSLWSKGAARDAQNAITFLSKFTGLSYPWPHMTAVASPRGNAGMEYPMMTLIGSFNRSDPANLYRVIAHELAHMWDPMQLATNERRYAWMDEGTADFNAAQALKVFKKIHKNLKGKSEINNIKLYLRVAGTDRANPIMRWSQHYYLHGYEVASYFKPASVLMALRDVLGNKVFMKAYHTYFREWQFKHPYPWDFFRTFNNLSGRDLNWFWRSWYYTTWTLDQAIGKVQKTANGTRITIKDLGNIPMPATVEITLGNGKILMKKIDVKTWLHGAVKTTLIVHSNADVTKVIIDPKHLFPDVNPSNNVWKKGD
jgi:hypothetical protein